MHGNKTVGVFIQQRHRIRSTFLKIGKKRNQFTLASMALAEHLRQIGQSTGVNIL